MIMGNEREREKERERKREREREVPNENKVPSFTVPWWNGTVGRRCG